MKFGEAENVAMILFVVAWYLRYPLSDRAIDKHCNPVDFLLTAKRDLDGARRFLP